MTQLYRIEEQSTTGWSLVEPTYVKLTKEDAINVLNNLMADGYNPDRLRAVPDQ